MPLILVTETHEVAPDGIHLRPYYAGETYDMATRESEVFLAEGWGVEAGSEPVKGGETPVQGPESIPAPVRPKAEAAPVKRSLGTRKR